MADIHIVRAHALGLAEARTVASTWAEQAQSEFGMACTRAQDGDADCIGFSRSGVSGTLQVREDCFVLDAKLGFLLGSFKDRIEAEIAKNLDALLAPLPAGGAISPETL